MRVPICKGGLSVLMWRWSMMFKAAYMVDACPECEDAVSVSLGEELYSFNELVLGAGGL